MRIVRVLLLTICLASNAFAQLTPLNPTTPGVTATTMVPGGMVNGKFQVGYDGRGDYTKNAKLEKQPEGATANTASTLGAAPVAGTSFAPVAANPAPGAAAQAAAVTTTSPQAMRSDSALSNDNSKAKAAAAAAAASSAATTPKPAPAATNSGPMVLVNGQIQKQ